MAWKLLRGKSILRIMISEIQIEDVGLLSFSVEPLPLERFRGGGTGRTEGDRRRQEFHIIGRVSRGYNFPTQFSFQSPRTNLAQSRDDGGWQMAKGGGEGARKRKS